MSKKKKFQKKHKNLLKIKMDPLSAKKIVSLSSSSVFYQKFYYNFIISDMINKFNY